MTTEFIQELRYRRKEASQGVWYGRKPNASFDKNMSAFELVGVGAIFAGVVWVLVWIVEFIFQRNSNVTNSMVEHRANSIALLIFFIWLLKPYLKVFWLSVKNRQKLNLHCWKSYTFTEKTIANIAFAYLLMIGINSMYAFAVAHQIVTPSPIISTTIENYLDGNAYHHSRGHEPVSTKSIELNDPTALGIWGILSLVLWITTTRLQQTARPEVKEKKRFADKHSSAKPAPFGLWLGESTGQLSKLYHGVGMASGQQVALFGDDAAQNILVLGATGSGKTTRAINPLLLQLLEQGCGGLIFDIKGDFGKTVDMLSQKIKSQYTVIGASERPFNLLAGLTPEIASSFLKSAFLLNGGQKQDGFWVDTATELCRNVLGMLNFLPLHYSLHGLYNYLFDKPWRNQCQDNLDALMPQLDDREQRLLKSYKRYYETIFGDFDEKVQAGVRATVAQVLSPFNHPELIDAFCTEHTDSVRLEDVLNGQVFLVNMPLSRWGLGAKVVYTFIKLRFFNIMQSRASEPLWNQDRFVFFLCDEYQEIVSANKDGLSDLNFWDKSRSSKTIGIISTQSVSSFYAAIGDRDMANALIQNFRQKICFRTEDENTISLLNRLLGMVEVQRVTNTQSSGSSSGQHSSTHSGQSTSISIHDKPLLDGQFFRTLPRDHALALLSLWGNGCDDVMKMEPLLI